MILGLSIGSPKGPCCDICSLIFVVLVDNHVSINAIVRSDRIAELICSTNAFVDISLVQQHIFLYNECTRSNQQSSLHALTTSAVLSKIVTVQLLTNFDSSCSECKTDCLPSLGPSDFTTI